MRKANIYNDWQNLEGFLGKGSLLQKLGEGLPFILKEANEKQQIVHYCERWLVEFDDGFRKVCCIRRKRRKGDRLSGFDEDNEPSRSIPDNFIEVFGQQVY